ncbi:MAG TPA: ferritin-like domain-containing protein [Bryobacteraceae bacterium]|jgi:ferritin-like metal-binding protein YciE|nr:ferritin-like domain-containing protein [Bryobacteraceae bacterium]
MALFSPEFNSLEDLFLEQIEDLYDAEHRIIRALPKMIEAAQDPDLKRALDQHLAETRNQVDRLDTIFRSLNKAPERETCEAMKGLIREGEDMVGAKGSPEVRDAAIIAAAQRVEHYEMAGYGTARSLAQALGHSEAARLLESTLQEEKNADQILTQVAERSVNVHALR